MEEQRKVVVTGDVLLDWKIASGHVYGTAPPRYAEPRPGSSVTIEPGIADRDQVDPEALPLFGPRVFLHRYVEAGGAMLLRRILQDALVDDVIRTTGRVAALTDLPAFEMHQLEAIFWRAHFVAAQFRRHALGPTDAKAVWRIKDMLGIDRTAPDDVLGAPGTEHDPLAPSAYPLALSGYQDSGDADVVVVDHLKQGFSKRKTWWPDSFKAPSKKGTAWLVVRWVHPQFSSDTMSPFWETALLNFSNKLIVVVTVEHLRLYGMEISRGLSWEKTVFELYERVRALWNRRLLGCAHLVVSFFPAGAVVFTADSAECGESLPEDAQHRVTLKVTVIYDPTHIEGSWAEGIEGKMTGSTRCLTAAIALEAVVHGDDMDLVRCVKAGLSAGRYVVINGFETAGHQDWQNTALPRSMEFPVTAVAHVIACAVGNSGEGGLEASSLIADPVLRKRQECRETARTWLNTERDAFRSHVFRAPSEPSEHWQLLTSWLETTNRDVLDFACEIARYGTTYQKFPFPTLRIGSLFSTDRFEMENLREVRDLIVNYKASRATSPAPISIGVFGPPGAGKSFAIKELARSLSSDESVPDSRPEIEDVTFNVAQFSDYRSLVAALHRVRDIVLAGNIPLVFWDEFDTAFESAPLGWLRYFLAPMQDGQFIDGINVHNVGPAIFVFAGGTFHSLDELEAELDETASGRKLSPDVATQCKLPDFLSRLHGVVNVPTLDYKSDKPVDFVPSIALRRAELLRRFLRKAAPQLIQVVRRPAREGEEPDDNLYQLLNIDQGVLEAFLTITNYNYGARSMEAIVKMSALIGRFMFDRSTLPSLEQLRLHVRAADFADLADRRAASASNGYD